MTDLLECVLKRLPLSIFLCLFAGLTFSMGAQAGNDIRLLATAGLTFGGDTWQVAQSGNQTPVTIQGGGKIEVGGGLWWQSPQYPLATSLTANYHVDRAAGVQGDAKFSRVPLEAMLYYTGMETLRIGVGVSEILSPTVKAMVDGQEQRIGFNNATGKSFELGYQVAPALWANLRLSSANYTPKTAGSAKTADVSFISLSLSHLF